jgi:hypothetical protein
VKTQKRIRSIPVLSLTSALDCGRCSTSRPGRLNPEKYPVTIGWAAGPVWTGAENPPPPRHYSIFNPQTVYPVASPFTDYALPAHHLFVYLPYFMIRMIIVVLRGNNTKLFPLFENRSFLHTRLSLHCSPVFTSILQKLPLTHYLLSIYFHGVITSLDSPGKCGCLHH